MTDSDLFLFVSHVREDRPAALEIVDELERRGVRCWIAPRDVPPGRPFDDEIVEAIDGCRAMLLIFSDRCNERDYIRREVTVAGDIHKLIIPLRIEDVEFRGGLRVRLSDLQWIDGFVSREWAIDQVIRAVDPGQARQLSERLTPEQTLAARKTLETSVRLDPSSAEALSELANVLMIDYLRGWNKASQKNVALAEEAVQKADAIDRSVALAHVAKAKIREVRGDLQGEIDALNDALKLDPDLADAYAHKANALILLGRAQEAQALLTRAIQLSPRDRDLAQLYWFMGRAYFSMKDYDNAIQWLKKSVEERPTTWFSLAHLIAAYALTGRLGGPDATAALNAYQQSFKAEWPLDKIKAYYTQPQYRDAPPQLEVALQEYFRGLEIAKQRSDMSL